MISNTQLEIFKNAQGLNNDNLGRLNFEQYINMTVGNKKIVKKKGIIQKLAFPW